MSDTIVDMPKVCQVLDNGWRVTIYRNQMGSYTAVGRRTTGVEQYTGKLKRQSVLTDDFTPEQALTRLAYKVFGEIL